MSEPTAIRGSDGYADPVARLLSFGDSRKGDIPNHVADLGLDTSHIPELIRMATDLNLHRADTESAEVWSPIHAMRALGQLRAEAAIEPLMGLLEEMERAEDDYFHPEFSRVVGQIGPAAIQPLQRYLADAHRGKWSRASVAEGLAKVGRGHPEARNRCVAVLAARLELAARNGPTVNGFIISSLVDLEATEAIGVIRQAYEFGLVDRTSVSWRDVVRELGIDEESDEGDLGYDDMDADDLPVVDEPAEVKDALSPVPHTGRGTKLREEARRRRKLARKARAKNRKHR